MQIRPIRKPRRGPIDWKVASAASGMRANARFEAAIAAVDDEDMNIV